MTEKEEKNIKEQDQEKEEQENEELKVIVPEVTWTTMPAAEFAEQPKYLQVFTDFYIAKFNQRDLEIMNTYDVDSNMVDINIYLLDNIKFGHKDLVSHALQDHAQNFLNIVAEIAQKDDVTAENMTSYQDWDDWYEDRRNNISTSLS
ncbi:hypothetical protein [Lactobacillus xylocopicola]|uniref:Uncharacterized protein n=1 Tax=Lactobacillus xylocopicola TaxID=2976676 RepID=A0ABM8BJ08_9LACO|nr:hypothetical protein [Lactobacillus xylocopicola]BDR61106.1 hypothetical protein KIM322_13670 [Lactobacillus xylocopicola]